MGPEDEDAGDREGGGLLARLSTSLGTIGHGSSKYVSIFLLMFPIYCKKFFKWIATVLEKMV